MKVGLWPEIEGFCHLHAKVMVIFLKYLLLAVTQKLKLCRPLWGNVFSSIDVRTMHSFFLLALYAFTCDDPFLYTPLSGTSRFLYNYLAD